MNVYDFDKTIFYPDSTMTFLKYSFRNYPRYFTNEIDKIGKSIVEYVKTGDVTSGKEAMFSFVRYIPDIDSYVYKFWEDNLWRIEKWYLNQKKDDDLIISASPDFLLNPLADMLGFNLIATKMDKYTGNILGCNNKGEEKVKRFKELYGDCTVDSFYSDSLSDAPMAKLAKKAYLVKFGKIFDWPM